MGDPGNQDDLTGNDLATWAALATVLEWLPPALDTPLVQDFNVTHFEYGILFALAEAPDQALRMSVLAGYANSSLSRLSRAVTRLQKNGWAERERDPEDGRSTLVTLTAAGDDLQSAARPAHAQRVRKLVLEPLTNSQRKQLHQICLRIQRAVGEEDGWRPGRSASAAGS
ncbi:MAG TPA: MarR family transcriptional regulator [Candidatus Corynebacterium avicola]|uniref:MarR family transcriptional regulator n=1 Tax=Candidatus Corynebacterium avicola TaxID=2838527 RepID=A0A9D1RP32_9CORY|nr:MarR family transcriptional regulator [Candidatus Corynebacterium avicola]